VTNPLRAAASTLVAFVVVGFLPLGVVGFMALFAERSVWTTAHGKRIVGRDAIHAFTERVLPGAMRESTARYDVDRIAFLRPDVAVVSVDQRPVTLSGDPLEGVPEGRPTYVLTREGDEWLIAAAQNTQVKEP
jgi:uncharacterized protein (TIGR02246 family)